jgi:hypothetical protein
MPFNRLSRVERARRGLQAALLPFDESAIRAAVWVSHGALLLLVLTGEAIRWVDYRDTLISAPMLRAVHAVAGFALASALLLRIAEALRVRVAAVLARRGVPWLRAAFQGAGRPAPARLLDAGWWLVVGLLVLSGLERYAQLRHGTSVLPLLSPAAWWALHRPLLPYLYAILLINVTVRGRMAARRALSYLYTP